MPALPKNENLPEFAEQAAALSREFKEIAKNSNRGARAFSNPEGKTQATVDENVAVHTAKLDLSNTNKRLTLIDEIRKSTLDLYVVRDPDDLDYRDYFDTADDLKVIDVEYGVNSQGKEIVTSVIVVPKA